MSDSQDSMSDSLLEGLRSADSQRFHEAFQRFAIKYHDRVYHWCRGIVSDPHKAEDATQEVFLKLMDKLRQYQRVEGKPFISWLSTVSKNMARNLRKRWRGLPVVDVDALADEPAWEISDSDSQFVMNLVLQHEKEEFVREYGRKIVAILAENDARLLLLKCEGKTVPEISTELEISTDAVNTRWNRLPGKVEGIADKLKQEFPDLKAKFADLGIGVRDLCPCVLAARQEDQYGGQP